MTNKIKNCKLCPLYKNQIPSVNPPKKSDIMFIGISSQKNSKTKIFTPLDISTNSGKFISTLESTLSTKTFHKTNLIKCAPLNKDGIIRYPTKEEIFTCFPHLKQELKVVNPKIIIPLGRQVTIFFSKEFKLNLKKYELTKYKNMTILPIDHPSYIIIYKRKELEQYKKKITTLVSEAL